MISGLALTKVPVSKFHFEDFHPGRVFEAGPRIVTREEILAFAVEFDPQPMHLDETAAQATMLGGLSASGWHACCLFMRMLADSFVLDSASMGSPGVDEVRWLVPVRPGDSLLFRAEVLEARPSRSRPDMGLVRFAFALINQSGRPAMTLSSSLMIARRGNAGPGP
jgi:acyl dehydratase